MGGIDRTLFQEDGFVR